MAIGVAQGQFAFEMAGFVKRFGGVVALDGANLQLSPGEVHALLGENGAGKTTLMNIAVGILSADAGRMIVGGEPVQIDSPREAFRLGLGMVHQQFRLVRNFSVAENVHLGWERTPGLVSRRTLERRTAELSERYGLAVKPTARIWQLSLGEMQRVAILRALVRGAKILILDEPTSVLTPQESATLFQIIRSMVADGRTVVFISHKLDEVMEIADRVTVLRAGQNVATLPKVECSPAVLARLMVGRELHKSGSGDSVVSGAPVLVATGIEAADERGLRILQGVGLSVRAGEILGVAGVSGNGQSGLAEVVTGMRRPDDGRIEIAGHDLTGAGAREYTRAGVGHIPEDLRVGLAFDESVEMNSAMKAIDEPPIARGPFIRYSQVRSFAEQVLDAAGLPLVDATRHASTLSGGQAQRLVVQRELRAGRRVLVAVHPTRGMDVSATLALRDELLRARAEGVAVLLISEDLDEVLDLSDRIVVMYEGQIVGEQDRSEFDRERIGLLMGGASPSQAHRPAEPSGLS